MRIAALALPALAVLTLAGCTTAGSGNRRHIALRADPSAVVATELAFASAAREDGQWTAFRKFAASDAVMFVPEPVDAHDWLSKQTDPPSPVRWQPHHVWSSCDGSLAVTRGAWQRPDGSVGYFTTVWERQRDDRYRWVLDQGDTLDSALDEPEMIGTDVADCPATGENGRPVADGAEAILKDEAMPAGEWFDHASQDNTLVFNLLVAPDGSRSWKLLLLKDGHMTEAMDGRVAASGR